MKCITIVFSLVLVAAPVRHGLAQEKETDFSKLQKSYKDAIEKATKPINATYVTELRKLLEKQTRAGKLDEAKIIMEEIEAVIGANESAPIVSGSDKELEKLVVGRTWKMVAGSKYNFKKDGEGVREYGSERAPFIWRASSPNIVEVTGKLGTGGAFRTFYFKLVSLKEAYYGDAADRTDLALTLD